MRWLALLLLLATPALADEIVMLAGPDGAMLQTRLCRPAQSGPAPLVIMNHGAMPRAEVRPHLQPLPCDAEPARWFTARGHVVAMPMRRAHGASTGVWAESFGPCEDPDFIRVGRETARDIRAALLALVGTPGIAPEGAIILGESAGGWGSIALAAEGVPGIAAVVNVAGGRGGWAGGRARTNCAAPRLVANVGQFGRTARLPMLWLYSANDSFFGPDLAEALFAAFTRAGGVAELVMLPPWAEDGHYFFTGEGASAMWGARMALFLQSLPVPRIAAR
ncbi:MAG: hypothetical protein NTW56_10590 [Alphaproteobacteria bacterium]|nr:hypothetical protein [Alphaproteobacteria bacterium]